MVDKRFKIYDLTAQGIGIIIPPFLMTPQFTEKECIKPGYVFFLTVL